MRRCLGHPKVTTQLVCVRTAERWPLLLQPFDERGASERGLVRDQQPGGQPANLVRGEHDVAHDKAECARERGHRGRRCVEDRSASTDSLPNGSNEFVERHRVGPGRVRDHAAATVRGLKADARKVVDVDGLHQIAPVARHDEERHAPQNPGDVVGQDIPPTAEQERWPDDHVWNTGLSQSLLDECLATVVGQRRIDRRIRDAYMNDASDAGTTSSLEQRSRVGDGVGEGRPASLESDPVRVVEGGDPFETARQRDWVLEPIRQGLDSCSEGMLAIRMMSKGSYLSSGIDQQFGDTRARVAERPRDQVRLGGTAAHGFRRPDSAGARPSSLTRSITRACSSRPIWLSLESYRNRALSNSADTEPVDALKEPGMKGPD